MEKYHKKELNHHFGVKGKKSFFICIGEFLNVSYILLEYHIKKIIYKNDSVINKNWYNESKKFTKNLFIKY